MYNFFFMAPTPRRPRPPHYLGFTITLRHTAIGRTPLDEWSAWHTDLYQTTHNTHNRQTFMSPAGFEPAIPESERPQTHALDRTASGTGHLYQITNVIIETLTNYLAPESHFFFVLPFEACTVLCTNHSLADVMILSLKFGKDLTLDLDFHVP